jgi:transcriptional regulator with XRE-family HTH domain
MVTERALRAQLAKELRGAWEESGVTQIEIGRRTGMTQPMVSDFFRRRYESPGWDTLEKVAHALGYEIELEAKLIFERMPAQPL